MINSFHKSGHRVYFNQLLIDRWVACAFIERVQRWMFSK